MAAKKKKEPKHEETKQEMAQDLWKMHEKKREVLYSYELFFLGIIFAIIGAFWTEAVYDYFIENDESRISMEFMIITTIIFLISMVVAGYKLKQLKNEVEKIEKDARKIEQLEKGKK